MPSTSITPAGSFSVSWGYNRDFFTPSDIHFRGPGYDFVAQGVTAHDRPGFGRAINLINTVAQYNLRVGYQLTEDLALSFAFDHMKYVATNGQTVRLDGAIAPRANAAAAGIYHQTPVSFGRPGDIVGNFEHTNGLNLGDLALDWEHRLYASPGAAVGVTAFAGGSFGIVVPKSDVTLFGKRLDNVYHPAGYALSTDAGLRLDLWQHAFIEARCKAGVVVLPDVLTVGAGTASHAFGYVEPQLSIGVRFGGHVANSEGRNMLTQ
jgi:hypothetical protein